VMEDYDLNMFTYIVFYHMEGNREDGLYFFFSKPLLNLESDVGSNWKDFEPA
jgi:hypothetical protein